MTIPLSETVSQYLDESNLGQAEYAKAYRIAIRGLRDLGWDMSARVKTEPLAFDGSGSALYPIDCVKILDFGISDGDGNIASFDKVDSFSYNTEVEDYENLQDYNGFTTQNFYRGTNYLNVDQGSLGIGSYNSIGRYRVDESQKKIFLPPNQYGGTYFIKYLSYETENCEYEVDIMASEALLCFIRWKFSMTGLRNTLQVQEQNKREYYREKTNAKMRIKKPTIQQLNKSSRQSVKLAIKS